MPNWAGYAYTKKGRALQAKVEAGAILEITKVVLGDGGIPADIENMNDLVSPKLEAPIVDIAVNGTTCTVSVLVSNIGLQSSIYPSEAGIFAKDPDVGEILLLYIRDSNPDYLPAKGSAVVVSEKLNFHIGFSIAPEVNIQLNPAGLVTVEMLENHEKINRIWASNEVVKAGDIRYPNNLAIDSFKMMECTTSGTTGTVEPTWVNPGDTVFDGTAQWVVCDIRDTSVQKSQGRRVVLEEDNRINTILMPADVVKKSDFTYGGSGSNRWEKNNITGTIKQWCVKTTDSDGIARVTFPTAFPNAVESIVVTHTGGETAGIVILSDYTIKQGCSIRVRNTTNGTSVGGWYVYIQATGR